MSHSKYRYVLGALLLGGVAARADAQGFGDRLKRAAADAAKRTVERRATEKTEEATEAALDGAERRVKGAAAAARPDTAAPKAAAPNEPTAATATPAVAAPNAAPDVAPAAAPTYVGRDFTPGTRVLFATDFARDEIGDFPRAFRLKAGNAEVADVGGTRYLRVTSESEFEIPLPETLPAMFTVEFDFAGPASQAQQLYLTESDVTHRVTFAPRGGGIESAEGDHSTAEIHAPEGRPFRVQVMADGDYAKVYLAGTRVANMPNATLGRSNRLRVKLFGFPDAPALLGAVRVAAGGKDLYEALAGAGRVTADGILFDTNSDRLRAESTPVLKEIADMLTAHPELRLAIEGHTDNVGAAAANRTLSEKRAAAVKAQLVAAYGIDAARLTTAGFGASKPVASNDDEAGRQQNRRVVLVRQ